MKTNLSQDQATTPPHTRPASVVENRDQNLHLGPPEEPEEPPISDMLDMVEQNKKSAAKRPKNSRASDEVYIKGLISDHVDKSLKLPLSINLAMEKH